MEQIGRSIPQIEQTKAVETVILVAMLGSIAHTHTTTFTFRIVDFSLKSHDGNSANMVGLNLDGYM